MSKRSLAILPAVGIFLATFFYFCAASLYSQATTTNPAAGGYQHFRNYWCELYADVTFTGQPNPGRPYAMAATIILVLALFVFWFTVTALFADRPGLARTVRLTGGLGFAIASLIFTPLHDLVIYVGVPLGATALIATCIALAQKRHWLPFTLATLAAALSLFDYLVWTLTLLKPHQPLLQKSAFLLFFLWVFTTTLKVRALSRPPLAPGQ